MKNRKASFIIDEMRWERIFLNIFVRGSGCSNVEPLFYLKQEKGSCEVPIEHSVENGRYRICINIACVSDRSFLENGRWLLTAVLSDGGSGGGEHVCKISSETAYRLDELSRIFKYAENQMAYNISFGVSSQDEKTLDFYIDSYFLEENRKWRRRRYVREVRGGRDKLKRFFMYASIILIRCYYHVLYALTPKKGNRVMLMSETKDVLWGNLKYIDDRIRQRHLDDKFRMTYSYRSAAGKHQSAGDITSWIKVVTRIAMQDVIFVDDYAPVFGFFRLGKKTKLIQVWHAGEGFKSVGYSRFGKDGSPFPMGSCHKQYTHVITGSEHLVDVFREVFGIEKEAFYPVGMPRLDGFLDENRISAFRKDFYGRYPELEDKRIILFAPTYRGAEQKEAYYDYDRIDLTRIYEFCKGNNYVFLIKMHPFVKELISIPEEYSDAVYEFSGYPNINDLYYITDILITDYSSNYFEYALMQRPVLFYTYDREIYELTRGVHRSIRENAPGKVCDTFDELMQALTDGDFEEEKIKKFVEDNFGEYQGNASDRVIDEILLQGGTADE